MASNLGFILFITPSYEPAYIYGGPTLSVSRLARAIAEQHMPITVITTLANGSKELAIPSGKLQELAGVSCFYFSRWTKDHSHFSPSLLWSVLTTMNRHSVIHIHSWWNLVTIPAVLVCRLRGVRPVLSPRGMLSPYTFKSPLKRIFHRLLGRWLLKGTVLHATSAQEAEEALALIPDWPYFILPNIIELPNPTLFTKQTTSSTFQLIFLSRIHPKKGLETLFEALIELKFSWSLQIIGEGDQHYIQELQQLAQKLGINARLEWLGWKDGEEKFQSLANADLFILPSQNENFANVVLEALGVGTPVLVSDQVGLSAYVRAQDLGWVYSGTSIALKQCINDAFLDVVKRARIRESSAYKISVDFGERKLAELYLQAYQEYLSQ